MIDNKTDADASTGDFEILHIVPISRFQTQKIELGLNGKKVISPVKVRKRFVKTYTLKDEFCIEGKAFKIKTLKNKRSSRVDGFLKPIKKFQSKFQSESQPPKLFKISRTSRSHFQTKIVLPSYSNDSSYIQKLPSILQSKTKKINLCDLIRCLSIQKNHM